MNWNLGMRRVSAVFWGAISLFVLIGFGFQLAGERPSENFVAFSLGFIALAVCHRATCWVIDGFSSR